MSAFAQNSIVQFEKFCEKEINSAVDELKNIKKEANRKHLQRLVFVNVVNRFDTLVDLLLLDSAETNRNDFQNVVLSKQKSEPITNVDFYEALLSLDPRTFALEKIKQYTRLSFLTERHSQKLRVLLEECYGASRADLERPRVNANNGKIHDRIGRKQINIPVGVIGFSDYLYSKRNAFVHGDGTSSKLLPNDASFLERTYRVKKPKFVSIKLSTISTASTFYRYICKYLQTGNWPEERGY